MKITLSDEEYNVLNKISHQTKMDCWFHIGTDDEIGDCVFDLENQDWIPMRRGVVMLNEGIVPELLKLTDAEIFTYVDLLQQLDINDNPFEEYIRTIICVYDGNANGICTEREE